MSKNLNALFRINNGEPSSLSCATCGMNHTLTSITINGLFGDSVAIKGLMECQTCGGVTPYTIAIQVTSGHPGSEAKKKYVDPLPYEVAVAEEYYGEDDEDINLGFVKIDKIQKSKGKKEFYDLF